VSEQARRYEILLTASAQREMHKLPEAVYAAVAELLSGPLSENPHRVGKRLVFGELRGSYSARRGTYRIIYDIIEDRVQVQVIRVRHRRLAYRSE
jgi:mRNA interferase RelE/StbE